MNNHLAIWNARKIQNSGAQLQWKLKKFSGNQPAHVHEKINDPIFGK
jgi:hypothetical protein